MKTLIVGDLHTKCHILDQIINISKNYDKVVFLGDYVDDWGSMPEASWNILNKLKDFYTDNVGKVILLLGNHDLSEWLGKNFKCSGWNTYTSNYVGNFMSNFIPIFRLAYAQDGYLFTHAGITRGWAEKYIGYPDYKITETVAGILNHTLNHYDDEGEYEDIFFGLSEVGFERGGYETPSPIWADMDELITDPVPELNQVVGHSPVNTILKYQSHGASLYFCDTFSTYSTGSPIGDSSLLVLDDGKFYKINLDNKIIPW